eukprot:s358_g9.t1
MHAAVPRSTFQSQKCVQMDYDQLFEAASRAADAEWLRLIGLGVLKPTKHVNLEEYPPIAQLRTRRLVTLDVKDAYLMRDQPRKVKIVLDKMLAEKLNLPQEWILGKVLPGQRERAAECFQNLRSTLKATKLVKCMEAPTVWAIPDKTMAILVHVDNMVVSGIHETVTELVQCLHGHYKIAAEEGDSLTFLKHCIEVTKNDIRIRVNEKYLEGLVSLLGCVKKKKTPGEPVLDETPLKWEVEINVYRSCVGTFLCISGDRPDIQFHVKELAGRLQSLTVGPMKTPGNLVGYLAGTTDFHVKMEGKNPAQSFRCRAEGVTTCWLLEVATDSDWSGNEPSCSTWWVKHSIEAVLYGDNTSCVAIAAKEGVGKIKHLSGRLLWIQQRQGKDFQLQRLDTTTNVADAGTKALPGRRMRFLLFLMGFTDSWDELGRYEYEEERAKKEARERLKTITKVVNAEVDAYQSPNSTLASQVAKKLMRLTLGALLVDSSQALGLSSNQCYVVAEASSSSWTVFMLAMVIVVLIATVGILLKSMHIMHKKTEVTRDAMDWLRMNVRERRMRARIRNEEQARTGIYLETEAGESSEEKFPVEDDLAIRMVTMEEINAG